MTQTCPETLDLPCCAAADLTALTPDELRRQTYLGFLYSYGESPCLDLGAPLDFTRTGTLYRQDFARGVTLANVGDEPVEVALDRGYLDLGYALCRSVTVPPRSAEILLALPRVKAALVGLPGCRD